jgi:hypothetical protein
MAATIDATTRAVTDRSPPTSARLPHRDPIISFRGQFCYVSPPGPTCNCWLGRWRQPAPPSPVLRLRYQGHIDRCMIAIYKYSSETYTEGTSTSFARVRNPGRRRQPHLSLRRPQTPNPNRHITPSNHTQSERRTQAPRRPIVTRASARGSRHLARRSSPAPRIRVQLIHPVSSMHLRSQGGRTRAEKWIKK